jgi:hypothetical protein
MVRVPLSEVTIQGGVGTLIYYCDFQRQRGKLEKDQRSRRRRDLWLLELLGAHHQIESRATLPGFQPRRISAIIE